MLRPVHLGGYLLFLLAACGGTTKTVSKNNAGATNNGRGGADGAAGAMDAGGTGTVEVGVAGAESSAGDAVEAGQPTTIDGPWHGYVEGYMFSDKSDAVEMSLLLNGAAITGQVTFGMSPPPPPATDPTVGYPPAGQPEPGSGPYPGFAFTIRGGTLQGSRLQLEVAPVELWKDWCALQTPIVDDANPGQYSCVHNWGIIGGTPCRQIDPMTHQEVVIDCGKYALCQGTCVCTSMACSAGLDGGVRFDLNISPPRADGSASGLDGDLHNVHLTKG